MADLPFLLPHDLLRSMHHQVSEMKLDHEACPDMAEVFVRKCQNMGLDPLSAVPLGMHGDGAPFTKKDSLAVSTVWLSLMVGEFHAQGLATDMCAIVAA